ncbi:pyridoxamine 5'-phosphate oxidase family protein [Nocardioides houyundeii]|uniref:pyridoxamine 5'-phosphate oxidase family protein n=1 Tax=Nocardioides houyundeii TaxID=2045452 RepID=UPI000C766DC4|nr:pyridoxamine 5'-phosphate oxidase family protein [Nocardioides houyundeii]
MPEQGLAGGRPGEKDIEDLAQAKLGLAEQQQLWDAQTECVLSFLQDGLPTAVVMSFQVDQDGHFWFATVEGRRQVRGVDSDPRVAVVVSNTGTDLPGRRMVALRGEARVHRDREVVRDRVRRLAPRLAPEDPDAFVRLLDSPKRVVIEVVPTRITASHDSTRLAGDGRGGKTPSAPAEEGSVDTDS